MRHRPIDREQLRAKIDALKPTWRTRAAKRTAANRLAAIHASGETGIWSEIKPVFMRHQRNVCAYCERRLGSEGIEWDVEHFRPKGRVDAWSSPSAPRLPTGTSEERGYYLLAFDPENYLAACKPCNSVYKGSRFPIAGRRAIDASSVAATASERAYLLNPLDPTDPAPETLIGFYALTPRVLAGPSSGQARARVTIELLGLAGRPDLDFVRARAIMSMWLALSVNCPPGSVIAAVVAEAVHAMAEPGSPMSTCATAFRELYERDSAKGDEIGVLASRYVISHSR